MNKKIQEHRNYRKAYSKLPKKLKIQTIERIQIFLRDRQNEILNDHPLHGKMKNQRSFSVTGDYRIIYKEIEKEIIFLFLDIGKHGQDIYH